LRPNSSLRAPRRSVRGISLERSRPPFGGSPALRARPAPCAAFSIVLARLFRRQYRHSEYGRFLIQTERTRDLVADRRQTAQILDDGADIGLRQSSICAPWHDGREDAAVRPNSRLNGGRDLVLGPIAKSRDLVGREIRSNEHAQPGNLQAHVGTSQEP